MTPTTLRAIGFAVGIGMFASFYAGIVFERAQPHRDILYTPWNSIPTDAQILHMNRSDGTAIGWTISAYFTEKCIAQGGDSITSTTTPGEPTRMLCTHPLPAYIVNAERATTPPEARRICAGMGGTITGNGSNDIASKKWFPVCDVPMQLSREELAATRVLDLTDEDAVGVVR